MKGKIIIAFIICLLVMGYGCKKDSINNDEGNDNRTDSAQIATWADSINGLYFFNGVTYRETYIPFQGTAYDTITFNDTITIRFSLNDDSSYNHSSIIMKWNSNFEYLDQTDSVSDTLRYAYYTDIQGSAITFTRDMAHSLIYSSFAHPHFISYRTFATGYKIE